MPSNTTPTGATPQGAVDPTRQLIAGAAGHALQWYNFLAYSYLAVYFSDQFFPKNAENPLVPLIATYGIFAIGFLVSPMASLVLGPFADRHGRRSTLFLTIIMMAAGSLLIAVCPTYETIGAFAPGILLLARIIQGIAEGGEFAAGSIFLAESATEDKRGFFSSFMFVGSGVAKLVALGLVTLLTAAVGTAAMTDFGWRFPFALGAVGALFVLWFRRAAVETIDTTSGRNIGSRSAPFEAMRAHPVKSIQVFTLTLGISINAYFWSVYYPIFASTNSNLSAGSARLMGLIGLVLYTILIPFLGLLSDRVGRKPLLLVFCIGSCLLPVPLLGIAGSSFMTDLLVQIVGLAVLACGTSTLGATIAEMFPSGLRVTGMAFPYNVANAVFGGTVATIGTALVSADASIWMGWYLVAGAAVSLVTVFTISESNHLSFDEQVHAPIEKAH